MRRWSAGVVIGALLATGVGLGATSAAAAGPGRDREVVPCSRGLVALTFDDGPSPTVTPRLVRLLQRLDVPATFFMVGTRVSAYPELARRVFDAGFVVGNHTWEHADLTEQSAAEIRRALQRTRHALVAAGVPAPTLVRPPYGAVDDRVRGVVAAAGYTPVLWTIDSRDWADGTPRQIADRVLAGVHRHRSNIVLQHDGVTRSPLTLRALPREVEVLRARGFCFAALGPDGRPTPPVPVATVSAGRDRIGEGEGVRLTVRLDRPTSRATTALVAAGGTAAVGSDVAPTPLRARFAVGQQVAHLWLQTRQDRTDELLEEIDLKVYGGHGVQPAQVWQSPVLVGDDDPAPVATLAGATVTAAPLLTTTARVEVRLDRSTDRPVRVVVRSPLGPAAVVVPPGSRHGALELTVPPGAPRDGVGRLDLRMVRVVHAAAGPDGTLVVRPPRQSPAEARREAVAAIRWPLVGVPPLY